MAPKNKSWAFMHLVTKVVLPLQTINVRKAYSYLAASQRKRDRLRQYCSGGFTAANTRRPPGAVSPVSKLALSCNSLTTRSLCSMNTSSSPVEEQYPILPGNILRSPIPDLHLPTDVSIHQIVFDICNTFRDKLAVEEFLTGRKYAYGQLKEAAARVASALYRKGYRKGDVLLVFSTNNVDYIVLMVACAAAGVWFSTASPAFIADELAKQLSHCDAKGIITVPELAPVVKEAVVSEHFKTNVKDLMVFGEATGFEPFQNLLDDDGKAFPDVDIDPVKDVFVLPYSSGTTGFPKGVLLSHHNCVANFLQYGAMVPMGPEDRCLGLLPLFHIFGMTLNLFPTLMAGASITYLPKFLPKSFLMCLQEQKISVAHLVPPFILFLAKHPVISKYDLSSVKRIVVGAAPLEHNLITEFLKRHPNVERFIQGFGMTETSPLTFVDTTQTLGSVGPVVPNTLAKIVDPEIKNPVAVGTPGEICVKGPQVMLGYHKNKTATSDMITSEGWLHTGDIGYFNERGVVFVQDRLKELIKYDGLQVAPAELEALLLSHPDIQDVAVVGVLDEAAGELPRAFVVLRPGSDITEDKVASFVNGKVALWKRLRGGVQFVDEIPKSPSGKILRRVLKAKYL